MSLDEAARQLQLAMHDAQVAFDLVGLGDLDRARTHLITARVEIDAAEATLKQAMEDLSPEQAEKQGEEALSALEEGV